MLAGGVLSGTVGERTVEDVTGQIERYSGKVFLSSPGNVKVLWLRQLLAFSIPPPTGAIKPPLHLAMVPVRLFYLAPVISREPRQWQPSETS